MANRTGRTKDRAESLQVSEDEQTHVIISIGGEHYGIDVMDVKIISGLTDIRPVPNAMTFMLGVITIQDTIVPVIDMRIKFNIKPSENTKTTVIVIVTIAGKLVGLLVDSVLDVTTLQLSSVQETPHFTASIENDCIKGISRIGEKLVVIINTEKIFTGKELEQLKGNDKKQ